MLLPQATSSLHISSIGFLFNNLGYLITDKGGAVGVHKNRTQLVPKKLQKQANFQKIGLSWFPLFPLPLRLPRIHWVSLPDLLRPSNSNHSAGLLPIDDPERIKNRHLLHLHRRGRASAKWRGRNPWRAAMKPTAWVSDLPFIDLYCWFCFLDFGWFCVY